MVAKLELLNLLNNKLYLIGLFMQPYEIFLNLILLTTEKRQNSIIYLQMINILAPKFEL
jgi:hypothetical protein